jgi:DNA polymerase
MLFFDTETYSELDIFKVGGDKYTRNCEIMLAGYAFADEPASVVDLTNDESLEEVVEYLKDNHAGPIIAHNSQFDRWVVKHCLGIDTPVDRWIDTMIMSYTNGLPGALASVCSALEMSEDEAKDKAGKSLINRFCKPAPSNHKAIRYDRITHPELWEDFKNYCRMDIESMRTIYNKLKHHVYPNSIEYKYWCLDQASNDMGIYIDIDLAHKMVEIVAAETEKLNAEIRRITNNEVSGGTSLAQLKNWLVNNDKLPPVACVSLNKEAINTLITGTAFGIPEDARRVLEIRQQLGKSSTAKYIKLIDATVDNRLRGTVQFYGANRTGRDAGRLFQPQNLPRPAPGIDVDKAIESLIDGTLKENIMETASSCLRSSLCSPVGKKLVVADLSNIEGRVLAWLAGEEWKIKAFRDYDNKRGPDIYKLAYSKSFNTPIHEVTKEQRQLGKVQELALGYQGSIGAFNQMAAAYNIDLQAHEVYSIVTAWRSAHEKITKLWKLTQAAAVKSIKNPGDVFSVGKVSFLTDPDKSFMYLKLPSGRTLFYHKPYLYNDEEGRQQIAYQGQHQQSKKWVSLDTYGGKLVENITQAVARDILFNGYYTAMEAGIDIVLRVHDELVAEVFEEDSEKLKELLCLIMSAPPPWAKGLPLAAEGYSSFRYRK